jgi:hypothetical protein
MHRYLIALALPLLLPSPARAQTQTYLLSGTVTSVSGDMESTPYLHVGAPIWGVLNYNPSAGTPQGNGLHPGLQLNIGGYAYTFGTVNIGSADPGTQSFDVYSDLFFGGSGPLRSVDPRGRVTLVNGVGSAGVDSLVRVTPTGPAGFMSAGGVIGVYAAPEGDSLALAVPCLLPGVWWWRRRYSGPE